MGGDPPFLEVVKVGYEVDGRWLVRAVDLTVEPGTFTALLGPNGAGKTTLLRLISGELTPSQGDVALRGASVSARRPEDLARIRALLQQRRHLAFPFTAEEVVRLGRHPHRTPGTRHDEVVNGSLDRVGARSLAPRIYPTLSGGEATRVDLARVLAQEPALLLLDEPTNHLDPRHQHEMLEICSALTAEGCAVVAVLHDLNLAALHAHRVLILSQGEPAALGAPREVLTAQRIEEVFGLPCQIWEHPSGCPWVVPCPALRRLGRRPPGPLHPSPRGVLAPHSRS